MITIVREDEDRIEEGRSRSRRELGVNRRQRRMKRGKREARHQRSMAGLYKRAALNGTPKH